MPDGYELIIQGEEATKIYSNFIYNLGVKGELLGHHESIQGEQTPSFQTVHDICHDNGATVLIRSNQKKLQPHRNPKGKWDPNRIELTSLSIKVWGNPESTRKVMKKLDELAKTDLGFSE